MAKTQHPNRLREIREARNLKQSDVAEALGLDTSTVTRHEAGTRSMDGFMLERYSRYYGVPIFELFVAPTEG